MKVLLKLKIASLLAYYLNSGLSKHRIERFIKKNDIDMSVFPKEDYKSFGEFFARKKLSHDFDKTPTHFISPCDGLLSVYKIEPDSSFIIKGSEYSVNDLVRDKALDEEFQDGLCLIFRLTPSDYHHYIFVDDCHINQDTFLESMLHSVQPIACERYPVYRQNRRCYNVLKTKNFGKIVQIEIGALAVGGIINEKVNGHFRKGEIMGHFELCGSSIAFFIKKDTLKLIPEIEEAVSKNHEYRVFQGMHIASKIN